MAPPVKDITNVLVGRSNFYIANSINSIDPTEETEFDEAWSSHATTGWYHPGASDSGLDFSVDKKEKRHYVDDFSGPAVITVEETTLKVGFVFAEATLRNLMYASGGGTITNRAATSSLIGLETLKLSEDLQVVKIGFEGKNPQGFWRRVIIPRVVSIGKIKAQLDRSKNKQVYAAEFESICPIEQIFIGDKKANKTA